MVGMNYGCFKENVLVPSAQIVTAMGATYLLNNFLGQYSVSARITLLVSSVAVLTATLAKNVFPNASWTSYAALPVGMSLGVAVQTAISGVPFAQVFNPQDAAVLLLILASVKLTADFIARRLAAAPAAVTENEGTTDPVAASPAKPPVSATPKSTP